MIDVFNFHPASDIVIRISQRKCKLKLSTTVARRAGNKVDKKLLTTYASLCNWFAYKALENISCSNGHCLIQCNHFILWYAWIFLLKIKKTRLSRDTQISHVSKSIRKLKLIVGIEMKSHLVPSPVCKLFVPGNKTAQTMFDGLDALTFTSLISKFIISVNS